MPVPGYRCGTVEAFQTQHFTGTHNDMMVDTHAHAHAQLPCQHSQQQTYAAAASLCIKGAAQLSVGGEEKVGTITIPGAIFLGSSPVDDGAVTQTFVSTPTPRSQVESRRADERAEIQHAQTTPLRIPSASLPCTACAVIRIPCFPTRPTAALPCCQPACRVNPPERSADFLCTTCLGASHLKGRKRGWKICPST